MRSPSNSPQPLDPNPWKRKPVKVMLWVLGGIVALALVIVAIGGGNASDDEVEAPEETAEVTSDDAEANEVEPAEEAASIGPDFDLEMFEGEVTAKFEIRDNFTRGLISSGAETDTGDAILAAVEEYPDYESVLVVGTFPTMDEQGNESVSQLLNARYSRETIEAINWDNIALLDLWDLADASTINPDLRG